MGYGVKINFFIPVLQIMSPDHLAVQRPVVERDSNKININTT